MKKSNLPKKHISFSQLNAFRNCKKFFHDYYNNNETRAAVYGGFLHDVLRESNKYIRSLKDIESLGMQDIEAIYSKEFEKINLSLQDYKTGYEAIEKIALDTFNSRANIFLCEEELNIELYSEKEKRSIILKGILDRVDKYMSGLKIIDYKTSPLIPTKDKLLHDFQLNIYAIILREIQPGLPLWIARHSILAGVQTCEPVDEAIMAKTRDYAIDLWLKMEHETKWEAEDINDMCQYCPGAGKCAVYKKRIFERFESKGIIDSETALAQFDKVRLNRLLAEKEEDSIYNYLKTKWDINQGKPIIAGEKEIDFKTIIKTNTEINEGLICKDCKAITKESSAYQKIDISDIKSQDLKDMIAKVAKKTKMNRRRKNDNIKA